MIVCETIQECRKAVADLRALGHTIGFVPTMGALHQGHMSLVQAASQATGATVVSIFVNPTQFGQASDLENYPRDDAKDLALLKDAGVSVVFLPQVNDVYPPNDETIVETTRLANILHGKVRPGHFRGVTSVVARLFNIVQPDVAMFGEKDYQQLQIIKRMVQDLHFPVRIEGLPTQREADGLAMSSRNRRLSTEDRAAAVVISQALAAAQSLTQTPGTTVQAVRDCIANHIATEPRATLEGLDTVSPDTLTPMEGPLQGPLAIMISVQFSDILLIDQKVIS